MISKIKKPVSILLSLIMVFSVFAIVPLSASAASSYYDLARGTLIQPEDILSFEEIGSFKFADYDDPTIIHEVKGSDFSYNKATLSVTDGYYSFGSTKLLPTSVSPGGLLIADYDSTTKMATFGVQNITHSFDETTGTLTIGGSGVVPPHYAFTGSDVYGVVFTQSNLVKHLIIDATDMIAIKQEAFMAYTGGCVLQDVEINSTSSTPLIIEEEAVFYRSGNTVTVTVNAVELATVTNSPVKNYSTPVNLIYNVEQPITFKKNALTDPSRYLTVTFPTHCNIFIPGGAQFTDSRLQIQYDSLAEDGHEEFFWKMHSGLVEGTDYVLGDARYEELTPLNASLVVGNNNTALFSAYTITDESVNGTVTASVNGTDVTEAAADADVLLTVAPAKGYQFVSISAGDVSLTTVTEGSQYSLTMPRKFITVKAEFEEAPAPTYTVTWKNDDGTVIDTTEVEEGTVPTHADATKANDTFYSYTFAGWNDGENTYAPSELPAVTGDDTYTATFTAVPFSEVTVTTKADFETAIANNSVDTIIIGADIASGYAGSGNIVSYRKNVDRTLTIKCVGSEKYSLKGYAFRVGSNTSKAASLSFENVIIDGNCPNAISANGYDFFMTVVGANSSLNFKDGAVVCNFYHKSTQSVIEAGRGSNASGNNIQGNGLKGTINVYDGAEFYNLGAQFGIFRLNGNAVMNMYGGTVRNCTTYDKEAIVAYIANGAAFNMSGGEIKNCTGTSSSNNSVVYLGMWGTSTFTMTGGTITSNTAKHSVFLGTTGSSKITIDGDAKISGGSGSSNIYLANGRTITMHDTHLTEEADIWLYTATNPSNTADVKIATNAVKDDIAYIHSDNTVKAGVVYCDGETDWVYLNGVMTKLNNGAAHHTHTANTIWLSTAANDSNIELNTTQAVTWNNWDGTTIKTDRVAEGNTPSYDGETPTHAADAQYTYTFTGWTDGNGTFYAKDAELPAVTGDVTYTAVFDSTVNEYTITWKNDDGTVIDTTTVAYGEVPTHADATKAPDKYYTYTFAGWTPEVVAATADAEYTATFDATPKAVPAKLILHVGENGKVVMDNGTFGNATDASNITEIPAPCNIINGSNATIVDGHTCNIVEGGSINIATGGEFSFYPSADNTGVITAIPDEGYAFIGWYNGNTLYSSGAALTYQNISEDITLTAKFELKLFWKHSVTLGGDIGVNFYLNPAVLDTYTGAKTVTFSWDGNETTVDVPATATADGYKVTCNVVAAQMAHKIHAVVKADGTALAQTDDYSVQDYAETVYANPSAYDSEKPEQLKALAKALLNYGAMAQTVFASSLKEHPALANSTVGDNGYEGVTADQIEGAINDEASDLNEVAEQLGAKYYTNSRSICQRTPCAFTLPRPLTRAKSPTPARMTATCPATITM